MTKQETIDEVTLTLTGYITHGHDGDWGERIWRSIYGAEARNSQMPVIALIDPDAVIYKDTKCPRVKSITVHPDGRIIGEPE